MLKNGGDIEAGTFLAGPVGGRLYPGMTEGPGLGCGLIQKMKIFVFLSLQLFLTVILVVAVVKSPGWAGGGADEAKATAYTIITNIIIDAIGFALCVHQLCYGLFGNGLSFLRITTPCRYGQYRYMDWRCVNGDLVFNNFSFVDKLVSCFKLYIIGYDAVHNKGSEMVGFVCLLGCFLHWFAILYHVLKNYPTWVRTRVLSMLSTAAAGGSMLCRGMLMNNAWNSYVVPAIIVFMVLFDGGLLLRAQVKKTGGIEQSLCDLAITSLETTISLIQLIDLKGRIYKPWDADKILHLVGSALSVLIGICLIGLMLYNLRNLFLSKLIEWLREIARVFVMDEDGNVEEQAAEGAV